MAFRLHEAVKDDDAQEARALLNAGNDPLQPDDDGHMPAFYAFDLNKPELYAVLVVSHPEILEDERVPRIQNMPDARQQLAFLTAIDAEIERLPDDDSKNNLRLHNPKIQELERLKEELNFAAENHGMMGARRRRRRQRRGRKTVKARKSLKRKRNTRRR